MGSPPEVMQVTRGGGTSEAWPSEVWIKTVVSYSCCIRATRKPKSQGAGPVNSSKTHAPNEVPSHKKNLRQLGIQRKKKGRGPSNYRVWKRKRRVIRS